MVESYLNKQKFKNHFNCLVTPQRVIFFIHLPTSLSSHKNKLNFVFLLISITSIFYLNAKQPINFHTVNKVHYLWPFHSNAIDFPDKFKYSMKLLVVMRYVLLDCWIGEVRKFCLKRRIVKKRKI